MASSLRSKRLRPIRKTACPVGHRVSPKMYGNSKGRGHVSSLLLATVTAVLGGPADDLP